MRGRLWLGVCAALLGMAIPLLWLYTLVTPGEEAVKVRNGLVAQIGEPADFDWLPNETPATFLLDRGPVPVEFARIAAHLSESAEPGHAGGLDLALVISRHLMSAPHHVGGPVQASAAVAYKGITRHGHGYCADFTQVFTAIATAAGLSVRTWGISFEAFGAGHAFNEVFDKARHKWVLVDSFHSLYFVDGMTQEPLSVLEVHKRLLALGGADTGLLAIRRIVPDRFPFRSDALALDYYRRGMPQLALAWGSNVFDYDRSTAVRLGARVSRHLERALAIASGVYPKLRIYPIGVSERDVQALFRARNRFLIAVAASGLALLTFGWQLAVVLRRPNARVS